MEQFKHIDHEKEAKKNRTIVFFSILAFLVIPALTLSGVLKPENESLCIWFQRSGSLMVLIASFSEYFSIKMLNVFSPAHITNEPVFNTKLKYTLQAGSLMTVSAILIAIGTIVWGYGDLLL